MIIPNQEIFKLTFYLKFYGGEYGEGTQGNRQKIDGSLGLTADIGWIGDNCWHYPQQPDFEWVGGAVGSISNPPVMRKGDKNEVNKY